jgi:hypothetical protein
LEKFADLGPESGGGSDQGVSPAAGHGGVDR